MYIPPVFRTDEASAWDYVAGPAGDQANLIRMLEWQGGWSSLALAEMMRARVRRVQPVPADPATVSPSIGR